MLSNERAVCQSTCFIWVLQQTTPLLHTKDRWSGSSTAPGMEANTIWAQERHSFQLLQTLDLLGLEVCRPCTQIHVIRSFNCTMTLLLATAVPPWSPTSVAAIMTITGLLSILLAMEALAILSQTSLSQGRVKYTDFLLDFGASHATIPLCFRLSSNLQGQTQRWKTLQTSFRSLSKHRRQPDHLPLRKRLTHIYIPKALA